jgi:uncharacterized membrane protein
MKEEQITPNDIVVSIFLIFVIIMTCFNFYLFSNSFHNNLINLYSTNETYIQIDQNVTRYVTGFDGTLDAPFNRNEQSHLEDVRKIIFIEEIIYVILLVSLLVFIMTGQVHPIRQMKVATLIMVIFIFLLLFLMNFFNEFFTIFHKVLFPQGNWMFPSDSLMIQIYHEIFFEKFFFHTILTTGAIIIILFIITQIIKHSIELKELSKKKE